MDIKIVNKDETDESIFQDDEIEAILNYAEKWIQISNDTKQNELVVENVNSLRMSMKKWRKKYTHGLILPIKC
jgi:hypothetical protein